MAQDLAPELLEAIRNDFLQLLGEMELPADYTQAADYADKVGTALAEAFRRRLHSDALPDGRLYYNIADRVVRPLLEQDYTMVAEATAAAQQDLNRAAGLGLAAQKPPLNENKVQGLLDIVSNAPQFDDVAWVLDEPVKLFSRGVVDDTLRANVEFQGKAGLRPKVVRRAEHKCCAWCSRLAGSYDYPEVPKDVYRRHKRCRCVVEYDPGTGRRQNVHSKQWTTAEKQRIIDAEKLFESRRADANVVRKFRAYDGTLGDGKTVVHELIGKINPKNTEAANELFGIFCDQYTKKPYESMLVITQDGEVHFMTDHREKSVDCRYLGDKMRGSRNIHTHPKEVTQYSFSTDADIPGFFEDGSAVMEAVDYKYRYRFERPEGITWEQWDEVRFQVQQDKGNLFQARGIELEDYEENIQHVIIDETCRRLGLNIYHRERWK